MLNETEQGKDMVNNINSGDIQYSKSIGEDESIVLMRKIASEIELQNRNSCKLLTCNRIILVIILIMVVLMIGTVLMLYPKVVILMDNSNKLLIEVSSLIEDASVIIEELNAIDIESTSLQVTELIEKSTTKISSLDIDTLNKAILDFSKTMQPFAKLFEW